jgi:hypothetical protein
MKASIKEKRGKKGKPVLLHDAVQSTTYPQYKLQPMAAQNVYH